MGFFDGWDSASVISRKSHSSRNHHHQHHSSSQHKKRRSKGPPSSSSLRPKSRSRSRTRSPAAASSYFAAAAAAEHVEDAEEDAGRPRYSRHNSSRASFFGLPNASSRSFFGTDKHHHHRAPTSSYRRSPRPGFLARAGRHLRRLLRDLAYYARRHPARVFALVVLPLLTGGALTALLARFGLRLPPALEGLLGLGARAVSGGAVGLVGEAVRMAGGGAGGGRGVEAGRSGDDDDDEFLWEGGKRSYYEGESGGGWADTVRDWF